MNFPPHSSIPVPKEAPICWEDPGVYKTPDLFNKLQVRISKLIKSLANNSPDFDYDHFEQHPDNQNVVFMTQYNKTESLDRNREIIDSINLNIDNPLIDEVLLFTENLAESDIAPLINLNTKVKVIEYNHRMSYSSFFNYIYSSPNLYKNHSNIYLLSNSDCYFDDSIKVLKYINFEGGPSPLFLSMTRHEEVNGKLDIGRNPYVEKWEESDFRGGKSFSSHEYSQLPYLEPWSSDAWAFKFNTLEYIDPPFLKFDNCLGTNLCEILLTDDLFKSGVDCKNIGICGYVKCIHNHKSLYRKKSNISKDIKEFMPGILPDRELGIKRNSSNSINNCWRLISPNNWLDAPQKEHAYSDFLVTDISPYLYENQKTTHD